MGTRHTGALALMAQQHEVVHVIYCQSLREFAMTTEAVITIGKDLLQTTFLLMAPMLVVAMVIGLAIGIFQTISSIHEQTITFLPKVFGVLGVFLFCLPWMLRIMTAYTVNLLGNLTRYCQ